MTPAECTQRLIARRNTKAQRVTPWGTKLLLESVAGGASRFFTLDLQTKEAHRIESIPAGKLVGAATFQQRAASLCLGPKGLSLSVLEGEQWEPISLPAPLQTPRKKAPILLANQERLAERASLALLQSGALSLYHQNQWSLSPWRREEGSLIEHRRYLLTDAQLWVASDRGEFGGGLLGCDLMTGEPVPANEHFGLFAGPVTDITQNPGGSLWFTEGLHQGGRSRGGVYRSTRSKAPAQPSEANQLALQLALPGAEAATPLKKTAEGITWECFLYISYLDRAVLAARSVLTQRRTASASPEDPMRAASSALAFVETERNKLAQSRTQWTLEPASIKAICFAPDGAPHILTSRYGPVRFNGDSWESLFAWWPATLVADLWISPEDVVVVLTQGAGVVIWDRPNEVLAHVGF